MSESQNLMEKIVSLCKRRGFVFQGSEIYGGLAGTWDYGPLGVALKKNIKDIWWNMFVESRDDMYGLDAAILMNPKVWEASGHVSGFSDPLVECKSCHNRFRADHVDINLKCPECGQKNWSETKNFNLLVKTFLGSVEDSKSIAYLRGETAQAMFVDLKNILSSNPKKLPFGVAQIGKAFRNEITTGNFLFRLREFEQMEIEYFIAKPKTNKDWQTYFEHWRKEMWKWFDLVGIDAKKVHEHEIPDGERAHYSKRTIDFEFDYPFGQKELYGLAYRTDYDLSSHQKFSGADLSYTDPVSGEKFIPHVIEPSLGVDRSVLATLVSAYTEIAGGRSTTTESIKDMEVVLRLPYALAPIKIAILPLSKKEQLSKLSSGVLADLKKSFVCVYDETGSIGKRYRRQDEIGTPYCVTIDFDSLEDKKVTVRDRDSMQQERIAIV